jgi:hypothetical protein
MNLVVDRAEQGHARVLENFQNIQNDQAPQPSEGEMADLELLFFIFASAFLIAWRDPIIGCHASQVVRNQDRCQRSVDNAIQHGGDRKLQKLATILCYAYCTHCHLLEGDAEICDPNDEFYPCLNRAQQACNNEPRLLNIQPPFLVSLRVCADSMSPYLGYLQGDRAKELEEATLLELLRILPFCGNLHGSMLRKLTHFNEKVSHLACMSEAWRLKNLQLDQLGCSQSPPVVDWLVGPQGQAPGLYQHDFFEPKHGARKIGARSAEMKSLLKNLPQKYWASMLHYYFEHMALMDQAGILFPNGETAAKGTVNSVVDLCDTMVEVNQEMVGHSACGSCGW